MEKNNTQSTWEGIVVKCENIDENDNNKIAVLNDLPLNWIGRQVFVTLINPDSQHCLVETVKQMAWLANNRSSEVYSDREKLDVIGKRLVEAVLLHLRIEP